MVTSSSVKLLPYRSHGDLAESRRHASQTARGEAGRIVHLSLLEKRSNRFQMPTTLIFREAQTYTQVGRVTGSDGVPVGALIDIYV
jgi:hypothetical protein